MKFSKRLYKKPGDFFDDLRFVLSRPRLVLAVNKNKVISHDFMERLMLAVTSVNQCRYCSYFHTGQALKSGIDRDQISDLLAGEFSDCPQEQIPALLYAQHWADTDGHPDAEAVRKLEEIYGAEKAEVISLILHMIRIGNMSGNTLDYFRYRLSLKGEMM